MPFRLPHVFRALNNRNYALFFFGQGLSLIGTWLQQTGEVWLAYRMTNSALMLGVVGFASQIPTFVLAPLAGAVIDRWSRHRLVILSQVLAMLQAFVLAVLVISGRLTLPQLILLSLVSGLIDAIEIPARQSFVRDMVARPEDLANAIALNSSLVNVARLLGPTVAGLLIGWVGEGWCFFLNGVSYAAVIAALLVMRVPPRQAPEPRPLWHSLREGVAYAYRSQGILAVLVTLATVSLMGATYSILVPVFAAKVLHGGPNTLGFLMAASGIGALAAALYMANRPNVLGLGRVIARGVVLLGTALVVFSFSHSFWISWLAVMVGGFGMMSSTASMNTLLQTIVDDRFRGRIMSLFTMAFIGMAPLGNLLGGVLAERWGPLWTVRVIGVSTLVAAIVFIARLPQLRAAVRPVYQKLGLLPGVATGMQSVLSNPRRSS